MSNVPTQLTAFGQTARLTVAARRAGRRGDLRRRAGLPGVAGQCLSCRSLCTLSCRGILHIDSPGSKSNPPRPACAHLARPNGFPVSTSSATICRARPRPRRQPEFGDSRRAPALGGTHADARIVARSEVSRRADVPRCHPAGSERSARRGGHSRVGLHKLRWATTPPNPAAASRNPKRGLGDECGGRSRRWRCPWRGVHRWRHRPVKTVHRGLLITAIAGGLMLASQPLASAATQPAAIPTPTNLVSTQVPSVPAPIAGGQIDSVVGIGGGAVRGVLPVAGLPGLGI
jgi:hypothetical protein